jgi:hypothetical protein
MADKVALSSPAGVAGLAVAVFFDIRSNAPVFTPVCHPAERLDPIPRHRKCRRFLTRGRANV